MRDKLFKNKSIDKLYKCSAHATETQHIQLQIRSIQFPFVRFDFDLDPHYATGVAFLNYVCASNRPAVQSDCACDNIHIYIYKCVLCASMI